ncbi:MAG: metal-dependent hydrolase [Candidatus Woesearchaeota archaeon]|nr:metal-dependent hydrolase [Candidatus Woesearchaeota archaeon]
MLFITHILFAFLLSLFFKDFFNLNYLNYAIFLIIILFFSIFPDIDTPRSKLGRRTRPLSNIINSVFSHRKLFHSLFFIVLLLVFLFMLFGFINKAIIYAIILGYASHLFLDSLTKEGINFLYPFSKLKIEGFINTNSLTEHILVAALTAMIILKLMGGI